MENPENFKSAQYEKREILPAFQDLKNNLYQLAEDWFDKKIDKMEYLQKQESVLSQFIEKSKNVLNHAFQSESGSWYFMAKDGSCFRIKKDNRRNIYIDQPVMEKLYFVQQNDYHKVSRSLALIESRDAIIPVFDLEIGVIPLELSLIDIAPELGNQYKIIEESLENEKLVKVVLDRSDDSYLVPCPYHLGNPVKKIFY